MISYKDWDDYYQRAVLESSDHFVLKKELIRYSMSIDHSLSVRKALAGKAAEGDKEAKTLFAKTYIPILAGRKEYIIKVK